MSRTLSIRLDEKTEKMLDTLSETMNLKKSQLIKRAFHEWTQTPYVTWPAACHCRGILQVCDMPDILRALGERAHVVDPWSPQMTPVGEG